MGTCPGVYMRACMCAPCICTGLCSCRHMRRRAVMGAGITRYTHRHARACMHGWGVCKPHKCIHTSMQSIDGAVLFNDSSLDVIFVDGLHTFEGVAADIAMWLPVRACTRWHTHMDRNKPTSVCRSCECLAGASFSMTSGRIPGLGKADGNSNDCDDDVN